MTSIRDLYAMTEFELGEPSIMVGCYYNHIPHSDVIWDGGLERAAEQIKTRVEIRLIKYHHFDYRRFWCLATVWFDHQPVMVIQNAGREGDDYFRTFRTNTDLYLEMCRFIRSVMTPDVKDGIPDVYSEDYTGRDLIEFYGKALDGYFEKYPC